jgi:FkbM family methyltransferase
MLLDRPRNEQEIDFVYREIFEELSYVSHGITLEDGACIFDIGANVGLFTLFAGLVCPDADIYAFEPIPDTFESLRINTALYGLSVRLFQCGLSSSAREETFTYYPYFSTMSGRYTDVEREREVIKSIMFSSPQTADGMLPGEDVIDEMLTERLESRRVRCQLKTISEVIRENGVERIDLLKVDVEKSELDVLRGIEACDWQKIKQAVVEVHDIDGRLAEIIELLRSKEFEVTIKEEGRGSFILYAIGRDVRKESWQSTAAARLVEVEAAWHSPHRLIADARVRAERKLPEYMVPAAFVLLEAMPLSPNGKIERRALPMPDESRPRMESTYVEPRTPVERELVELWRELLGIEQIGIDDNFFELGGHSLLLTQLASRIRTNFAVEMPLRLLFDAPTIVQMTTAIAAQQIKDEDASEIVQMLEELAHLSPEEVRALMESEEAVESLNFSD